MEDIEYTEDEIEAMYRDYCEQQEYDWQCRFGSANSIPPEAFM